MFSLVPKEWFELLHHTVKSQGARNLQGGCCCKSPQETCVLWRPLDCTVGERVAGMKLSLRSGCVFDEGCVLFTVHRIEGTARVPTVENMNHYSSDCLPTKTLFVCERQC